MKHAPSLIATAVVVQAHYIITGQGWNDAIEHYSGYNWNQVKPVISEIQLLHQVSLTSSHQTVLEKYKGSALSYVLAFMTFFLSLYQIRGIICIR